MEKDYAEAIKKLVAEHYNHDISTSEYRISRKRLINQMDMEFNGNEFIGANERIQVPMDQSER